MKLSLQNFRAFRREKTIEVRPITILLGANSSGKSTITRLLPLIQQTVEARANAPLLWFGPQVDFGDFDQVINHFSNDTEIKIGFSLEKLPVIRHPYFNVRGRETRSIFNVNSEVKYVATLIGAHKKTAISEFEISLGQDHVVCKIGEKESILTINGKDYSRYVNEKGQRISNRTLFPRLEIGAAHDVRYRYAVMLQRDESLINKDIKDLLSLLVHHRTSPEKIDTISRMIPFSSKSIFVRTIKSSGGISSASFDIFMKPGNDGKREELRRKLMVRWLPILINNLSDIVNGWARNSYYIGPFRSSGQRYYRLQELAVDRLDPQGDNFAMYLMAMGDREISAFSDMFRGVFGYKIRPRRGEGHVSLEICAPNSEDWVNLADVGFGFSQVLPVLAQIHAATAPARRRGVILQIQSASARPLVLIEQPELHLHPAYQGQLAELFAQLVGARYNKDNEESNLSPNFILETHSESMVNRFADLVSSGLLKESDIVIHIFENDKKEKDVNIRSVFLSNDGDFIDWPIGFFTEMPI